MAERTLPDILRDALAAHADTPLLVAFSGGPDSTALLHALASLPEARACGLRAVHIDHGLHADSARWAAHCGTFCRGLAVPLDLYRVTVDRHSGSGLEAAAREARMAAFAQRLPPGACLLTAHHRDDQAETVLLKLLRGAGPEGTGGMRELRVFACGHLWRPLLDTPRAVLVDYLREHALDSIDDPSNRSPAIARSFLRQDILPRLSAHWPHAVRSITHSARLHRQAADYLQQEAATILKTLLHARDHSLDAHAWLALHPALRGVILDQWLHTRGFAVPTLAQREQLRRQIPRAHGGRVPLVQWPGTAVHIWRGRLHVHRPLPRPPAAWQCAWHGQTLELPAAAGTLRLLPANPGHARIPGLRVSLGTTGIRLRPAGDPHTRSLRDLFQQAGVPPWRRRHCPLIHDRHATLLAVADLWQTAAGKTLFDALGRHPRWFPTA